METRRLKLFVVAYLRGLLEPDYKHGLKSRIRESLILSAISDDLDSKSLSNSLSVDLSFVSSLSPENLSGHYDSIYDKIANIRELDELAGLYKEDSNSAQIAQAMYDGMKSTTRKPKETLDSIEGLVSLYKYLDTSGLMKKLVKVAREL